MARADRVVHTNEPEPRLSVYPSRIKLGFFVAFGVALAGMGWLMMTGMADDVVGMVLGGFLFVVGAMLSVFFAKRLAAQAPVLEVDRHGIHDRASALRAGFIPWSEVMACVSYEMNNQVMLGILLFDTEAILANMSPLRRRLMRINGKLGTEVNIPQGMLPVTVDELLPRILEFKPE